MMLTTRVLVAAVVVLAGVAVPAAGQEVVTVTVAVENQSGDPVGDATVTASWDGGSTVVETAANGKAFVDVPSGATVELNVTHSRYTRNDPYVVKDADARDVTVGVFRKGTIAVGVTDRSGPVADATVVARKNGQIADSGRTDADGQYRTDTIERGEYAVTVVKRGYYRNVTDLRVDGDASTAVGLRQGSVTLTFNVTDPHFDPPRPVGDVTLGIASLGEFKSLTDGEAKTQVPVNSRLELTASKDGYETVSRTIDVEESDRDVDVSVSRTPSLNLSVVNERVVVGESVVVDVAGEYGDPVEGATVVLDGESVATTDRNGRANVRIEETGEHRVVARTSDLTADPATVTGVAAGGETTAEATATETATDAPSTTTSSTPGFTALTGVTALFALAAFAALRRR